MCGIAGYYGLRLGAEERPALLRRMCDTLVHRGPDDDGYFVDDCVGLGMRRLSIIDLSTGHQPIANEDGTKHIIFNGEIYNYRDLRPRLAQQGHRLSTQSDTETILHQYEEEGAEAVHRLNGMFALAIWDSRSRTLFLARDRMGVKPLYYYWDGRHFLFASEIKALLTSGYVARTLNRQALWDYFTFRYVPQPETIWANVFKLPPAHTLTLSADRPEPQIRRYWDIPYRDDTPIRDAAEYLREFEQLFLDAVRLRLIADVPVGILLSGGIDSSAVAAAIAQVHNARLNSFSVAFRDSPATNELQYARQVAAHVGTDHHEILIGADEFCDFLPRLVHHTDEPLADLATVPLYYVSHLAREKVKVVLSGEGSDEILAGYQFDETVKRWDRLAKFQVLPAPARRIVELGASALGGRWAERVRDANVPLDQRLTQIPFSMTDCATSQEKALLLRGADHFGESTDLPMEEAKRAQTRDPLNQALYVYCQSWLVEDLLMKADRMTMANSIELRVPFLDYRLVEWAARSPRWVKVGKNANGRYETKAVLRQFARTRLPAEIVERPKQGFPVPVYDWLAGRLKPFASDLLSSNESRVYALLNREPVLRQLARGTQPEGDIADKHRLWNLLILELWLREWLPN